MDERILTVIFSRDRPAQLDATLRSLALQCHDSAQLAQCVLYHATSPRYQALYRRLADEHPEATLIVERDFRTDLIRLLEPWRHVLFLVDDNLFVRPFSISEMVGALEAVPCALGFSLRLGRNISYCYPLDQPQPLPPLGEVHPGVLRYRWVGAALDFGYPIELSSSLYRTRDLAPLLTALRYRNPNTLEAALAGQRRQFAATRDELLLFEQSVTFCTPINVVQDEFRNRAGLRHPASVDELAERFERGERIDVAAYASFVPRSCHEEVELRWR